MKFEAVLSSMRRGDIKEGLAVMRDWLAGAAPGEPEARLQSCPADIAPRVALLMRDLLSRYPATLLGAPVLLYCTPEEGFGPAQSITLPYPDVRAAQPCGDLHFVGWLPLHTQLPVAMPYRPEYHDRVVPLQTIHATVALFRSHPGVFDLDELELPSQWWGELFRGVPGNIQMHARMLLPYPDALEAARVLQASATGGDTAIERHFLSDNGWGWAYNAGALFQETCRHLFPPLSAGISPAPGRS